MRHSPLAAFGQQPVMILAYRHGQRSAFILPVGDQFIERDRVDYRAGQDVRADLAAFFQDADRKIAPRAACQVLQADRGAEPRRASPDDHDVILHGFAFAHRPLVAGGAQFDSSALPIP